MHNTPTFALSICEEIYLDAEHNMWKTKEYQRLNYESFCAGNKVQFMGGDNYKINDTFIVNSSTYPILFPTSFAILMNDNWVLCDYTNHVIAELTENITQIDRYSIEFNNSIIDTRNLMICDKNLYYNFEIQYNQIDDTTFHLTINSPNAPPVVVIKVLPGRMWAAKPQIDGDFICICKYSPGEKTIGEIMNGESCKFELAAALDNAYIFRLVYNS